MKKLDYIGKIIDEDALLHGGIIQRPAGKYRQDRIEIFLSDFECRGHTDRFGYTAYSVLIHHQLSCILNIERIGHRHVSGSQGSDDKLNRFPHKSLEEEAEFALIELLDINPSDP